jgi:hypothetical protein
MLDKNWPQDPSDDLPDLQAAPAPHSQPGGREDPGANLMKLKFDRKVFGQIFYT